MIRQFFIAMLILISIQGKVLAQYAAKATPPMKADFMFNSREYMINHRHNVYLPKGNKMIVELFDVKDYESLHELNTILQGLKKDMSFYKDSLANMGADNVRIDYTMTDGKSDRKIRFTRHAANGDAFIVKNGETARLKINQDTIRIRITKEYDERPFSSYMKWKDYKWYQPVQVTFLVNSFEDIDELINDNKLSGIIDTLAVQTKFKKGDKYSPFYYHTTVFYRPYEKNKELVLRQGKWENEVYPGPTGITRDALAATANIGVGLVRNTLAPMAEAGIEFRKAWIKGQQEYSLFNLHVSPYFLFSRRADGNYHTYDAWFVSMRVGSAYKGEIMGINFKELSVGAGYLLNPDEQYFKKHTFKVFGNFTLTKGVTISPEVIATDNFKNIFPALTLKVF